MGGRRQSMTEVGEFPRRARERRSHANQRFERAAAPGYGRVGSPPLLVLLQAGGSPSLSCRRGRGHDDLRSVRHPGRLDIRESRRTPFCVETPLHGSLIEYRRSRGHRIGSATGGRLDVLDPIGNTSMVRLGRVVPAGGAQVLAKLEWENPTGSMKDRMAHAVISRAEKDGRLRSGDTVVEYTGGSTGASLALVCAARGYRIRIVTSDAFSREKLDQMAALGAELTLVPSEGGRTTKKLILEMIEVARGLSREPRTC